MFNSIIDIQFQILFLLPSPGKICLTSYRSRKTDTESFMSIVAMPIRSCTCNPGYTGSGEGSNGCREITGPTPSPDPCVPNPCANGGNCFVSNSSILYLVFTLQYLESAACASMPFQILQYIVYMSFNW